MYLLGQNLGIQPIHVLSLQLFLITGFARQDSDKICFGWAGDLDSGLRIKLDTSLILTRFINICYYVFYYVIIYILYMIKTSSQHFHVLSTSFELSFRSSNDENHNHLGVFDFHKWKCCIIRH